MVQCTELWVFDGGGISEGMRGEIGFAEEHEIPIRYMQDACDEYFADIPDFALDGVKY